MPAEHRAILLIVGLAVAGHGARLVLLDPGEAPGAIELLGERTDGSPSRQRDSTVRLAKPLAEGERIDLDRAGAAEIARLPKVGPALARRIVARRDSLGRVGGLAGLDLVPGIGSALLREIAPHVAFSGGAETATSDPAPTGPEPATDNARNSRRAAEPASPLVHLNSASEQELTSLPGIGPGKARAIVTWRSEHGPFRAVDDLARVPGIGPSLLARIAGLVTVR